MASTESVVVPFVHRVVQVRAWSSTSIRCPTTAQGVDAARVPSGQSTVCEKTARDECDSRRRRWRPPRGLGEAPGWRPSCTGFIQRSEPLSEQLRDPPPPNPRPRGGRSFGFNACKDADDIRLQGTIWPAGRAARRSVATRSAFRGDPTSEPVESSPERGSNGECRL